MAPAPQVYPWRQRYQVISPGFSVRQLNWADPLILANKQSHPRSRRTGKWTCKASVVTRVVSATPQSREQAINNSAHSPSKIYAGKETKGNGMNTWLASLLFVTSLLAQPPEVRCPMSPPELTGLPVKDNLR